VSLVHSARNTTSVYLQCSCCRQYDDNMMEDYEEPEDLVDQEGEDGQGGGAEDPDQHMQNNVVTSGDPSGAAGKGTTGVKGLKEKRIPNEKRTTTPYMTKYERARVLGTRALQIRYDECFRMRVRVSCSTMEDADFAWPV